MIEFKDHEKIGNDHHLRRLSIVKQVLFVSSIRNVQRTVWRICILMLGFKRVQANIRSKCYFCVFRYCLFLIRYCIKCHFVFLYNSQQTFIFGDYLVILAAKRRNVQYIGYKYVTSIGRGCSFLICALIGSLR